MMNKVVKCWVKSEEIHVVGFFHDVQRPIITSELVLAIIIQEEKSYLVHAQHRTEFKVIVKVASKLVLGLEELKSCH